MDVSKLHSRFAGEDPRVPGFVERHFKTPLRVMFVGAHPDDPDVRCSGFARTLVEAGHRVRYVALCNGDKGHQFMDSPSLARRRYGESRKVIETLGIEDYIVADTPDCEVEPTIESRRWLTRVIREFGPHIIVTHRPYDYHCDHRATAALVQDATYLIGVPLWCPDVPVPDVIPTVFFMGDRFTQPTPFRPDFIIDVSRHEDVIVDTFACHESQMFEWLVPEHGYSLADVPPASDVEGRRTFIRKTALHLVADYARAFAPEVARAYPGRNPKLVEVYERSEYGRAPVPAERALLESLGGAWIDTTDSKWMCAETAGATESLAKKGARALVCGLLVAVGCLAEGQTSDVTGTTVDPCRLEFSRLAVRRFVLENDLPMEVYEPSSQLANVQYPAAAFDPSLKLVSTWCPCAHYSAEVLSLPSGGAATLVFATLKGENKMTFVFEPGKCVTAEGASVQAVKTVVPDPPFRCSITAMGNSANLLVAKDGKTSYLGSARFTAGMDWRSKGATACGKFFVKTKGAEIVRATSALSMGFGQADVRFVTTGRQKRLYFEGGRVFFTFSPRGIGALGVASFDPSRFDVRLEGNVLFDAGDGLLRGDGPADLYYDDVDDEWRAWVCNFSTVSSKDGLLSGREKGGVNYAWSKRSPLHGLSVMEERNLGLDGMNEDPTCFYDEAAGKWRMFLSEFTPDGIRGSLFESETWNGRYVRLAGPTKEDSTGQCLVALGDRWWAIAGSADQACHVYEYPTLRLHGDIRFDAPPWDAECPNGRVWGTLAVLPDGYVHKYLFLTMDRKNFPDIPMPNWTYGAIYLYGCDFLM